MLEDSDSDADSAVAAPASEVLDSAAAASEEDAEADAGDSRGRCRVTTAVGSTEIKSPGWSFRFGSVIFFLGSIVQGECAWWRVSMRRATWNRYEQKRETDGASVELDFTVEDHLAGLVDRVGKAAPEDDRVDALLDLGKHEGREGDGQVARVGADDGGQLVGQVVALELCLDEDVAVVGSDELLGLPFLLEEGEGRFREAGLVRLRSVRALVQVVEVGRTPALRAQRSRVSYYCPGKSLLGQTDHAREALEDAGRVGWDMTHLDSKRR